MHQFLVFHFPRPRQLLFKHTCCNFMLISQAHSRSAFNMTCVHYVCQSCNTRLSTYITKAVWLYCRRWSKSSWFWNVQRDLKNEQTRGVYEVHVNKMQKQQCLLRTACAWNDAKYKITRGAGFFIWFSALFHTWFWKIEMMSNTRTLHAQLNTYFHLFRVMRTNRPYMASNTEAALVTECQFWKLELLPFLSGIKQQKIRVIAPPRCPCIWKNVFLDSSTVDKTRQSLHSIGENDFLLWLSESTTDLRGR